MNFDLGSSVFFSPSEQIQDFTLNDAVTAYCQDPIHYFYAFTQQPSELLMALLNKLQTQNLKNACLWVKTYKDTSLYVEVICNLALEVCTLENLETWNFV